MSGRISAKDRLIGTLILSSIAYGVVVLGVGFTLNKAVPVTPTLDVVLSPSASTAKTEKADFLAQADNQGGGSSQSAQRPLDQQLSQLPQTDPGQMPVPMQTQRTPPKPMPMQRLITSQKPAERRVPRAREQKPASTEPLAQGAELVKQSLALAQMANEFSRKQNLQTRTTQHKYITASTREYAYAHYMNDWVRKVERVGNANYPKQALLNRLSGQLILTVAIRRDGRIENITMVKSSGNRVLDRAAADIVRLAEPFPALPKTAEDPSLLYITRTWQFIAGQTSLN